VASPIREGVVARFLRPVFVRVGEVCNFASENIDYQHAGRTCVVDSNSVF
jgi:hypothetical protein